MSNMTDKISEKFPPLKGKGFLPKVDKEILAYWASDKTFEASIEQRSLDNEYVFYDGPPFANGLPHYGHLLTGFVKDTIPRYQTMQGYRVDRRFGWDTHGLPAELSAEADLGISGRKAIVEFGIDRFNDACHQSVLKYTQDWEDYIVRQARWVDFKNAYKTLDTDYMESCLWAFKTLYDRGLVYQDYRVVPYSWAVESPLSNFETRLDNSYRVRTDAAITVAFKLKTDISEFKDASFLIWTTTPWTLPSNLAVAVANEIDYCLLAVNGEHIILATKALDKYKNQLEGVKTLRTFKGSELVGLSYTPPFSYFCDQTNAFQILAADFVSDDDGTGIVHMSPGFGEDDLTICRTAGIEVVVPVDHAGRFTEQVSDYAGMQVFEANKPIIKRLKENGQLFRHDTIDHNYPHCWRTDTPLIYKAVNSWYLKVSEFREQMSAHNQNINWVPAYVKDGLFGNWLANAQDWNISRSRFWGTPLPIWMSDDANYPRIDTYGSIEALEKDFGVKVENLHRPYIDKLTRPNPDDPSGKSTMRRVEEVFDCWFESGAMPFASIHYPFENKQWFEDHFPADFIVEYVAQTRGWFYTLTVLGTMLFDSHPFKNAICHGVVLDENQQKLSKRLRNYPDPLEFFEEFGSDTMRWFLISSPVLNGGDLVVPRGSRAIAQIQREAISPLINAYSFFQLYANLEERKPQIITRATEQLDIYIFTKTSNLAQSVAAALDQYNIPVACREVTTFMEVLTNWYIRRSRNRFWETEDSRNKQDAFDTLYTILVRLCEILAPLLPILAEKMYKSLTNERSVHLADWPSNDKFIEDNELVEKMDMVRDVCAAILTLRERFKLRVRLPLKSLTIAHPDAYLLQNYTSLIADEVNVRKVELSPSLDTFGDLELKINPKIGKRLGKKMKPVMAAAKNGDYKMQENGSVLVAGETLESNEFDMRLVCPEGSDSQAFGGTGAVILDISVDAEQEREGLARDIVRLIQVARKEAGLVVNDRIIVGLEGDNEVQEAVDFFKDTITSETLANKILPDKVATEGKQCDIQGKKIQISLTLDN